MYTASIPTNIFPAIPKSRRFMVQLRSITLKGPTSRTAARSLTPACKRATVYALDPLDLTLNPGRQTEGQLANKVPVRHFGARRESESTLRTGGLSTGPFLPLPPLLPRYAETSSLTLPSFSPSALWSSLRG